MLLLPPASELAKVVKHRSFKKDQSFRHFRMHRNDKAKRKLARESSLFLILLKLQTLLSLSRIFPVDFPALLSCQKSFDLETLERLDASESKVANKKQQKMPWFGLLLTEFPLLLLCFEKWRQAQAREKHESWERTKKGRLDDSSRVVVAKQQKYDSSVIAFRLLVVHSGHRGVKNGS